MNRKAKAAEFLDQAYNLTVTGRHLQVTDSMKNYVNEKLARIERFSPKIIDAFVTLDIQKLDHRADIVLKLDHIKIKSQASTTDMYVSIDQAIDKIERQLQRYKTRLHEHQAKGVASVDMLVNVYRQHHEDEIAEINSDIEEETIRREMDRYRPREIVSRDKLPLKTLNQEEAIMKLELSGDSFLIFRGEEDEKLKVLYRRSDGNFGLIHPEG